MIHAGTICKREDHLRIQMKVTHKDDISNLQYYENYNKVLDKENILPKYVKQLQQNVTCTFPGMSDVIQNENIRSSRGSDNGVKIGRLQKAFSFFFYGDSTFYDLSNAF